MARSVVRRGHRYDFCGIPRPYVEIEPWQARARHGARRGMSVEAGRDGARGRAGDRARADHAGAALRNCSLRGGNYGRRSMNLIPALQTILDELTQRFGPEIRRAPAAQPNELYLKTKLDLTGALCSAFYKKYQGRLAGVFAEDARAEHGVFFVYYLYALDSAHGFVLVRVPIQAEQPELLSLTNAVHAANWQEREIQELFGINLVGQPTPRRCV